MFSNSLLKLQSHVNPADTLAARVKRITRSAALTQGRDQRNDLVLGIPVQLHAPEN